MTRQDLIFSYLAGVWRIPFEQQNFREDNTEGSDLGAHIWEREAFLDRRTGRTYACLFKLHTPEQEVSDEGIHGAFSWLCLSETEGK
jgi:hypothetical protein